MLTFKSSDEDLPKEIATLAGTAISGDPLSEDPSVIKGFWGVTVETVTRPDVLGFGVDVALDDVETAAVVVTNVGGAVVTDGIRDLGFPFSLSSCSLVGFLLSEILIN